MVVLVKGVNSWASSASGNIFIINDKSIPLIRFARRSHKNSGFTAHNPCHAYSAPHTTSDTAYYIYIALYLTNHACHPTPHITYTCYKTLHLYKEVLNFQVTSTNVIFVCIHILRDAKFWDSERSILMPATGLPHR